MPEAPLEPEKRPEEEIVSKGEKTRVRIITLGLVLGGIVLVIVLVSVGRVAYRAWFKPEVLKPKEIEKPKEVPEVLAEEGDADSDGMPNGWESTYGLNPRDSGDALGDLDNDGLTNLQEYMYGADPKNSDTDKDGYLDGQEVEVGYDPAGPGRLREPLPEHLRLAVLQGTWSGLINGAVYSSNDVVINLTSGGKLTGDFTFILEDKKVQNKVSGEYDFNDKINAFSGDALIRATIDKTSSQYKLSLYGLMNKEKSEIIGTFTLDPQKTRWLERDRGTFKLTKTK